MEKKEYYTMILRDEEGYVGEAVYAGPETLKVVTEPGGADRLVRMIRKFADFIETTEAERKGRTMGVTRCRSQVVRGAYRSGARSRSDAFVLHPSD